MGLMMQRNSTTLFLTSPGATTPIPWDNNAPDFTGFTEPTLSVLQQSWQNFLESGEPLEVVPDPEPPTPQPRSIDMRRLRLALLQMDLLDSIDAVIAGHPRSAQIEWEFATNVQSDHQLVLQIATAMSLNINQIFDLAETFA